jgi:hypothetical protein
MTDSAYGDSRHRVTLYTTDREPLLTGGLKALAEYGLKHLPARYPGLRVLEGEVLPDRVRLVLDFQRLDEDLLRVVQSYKLEVKNLAKKKGLSGNSLWQWAYDEESCAAPRESFGKGLPNPK